MTGKAVCSHIMQASAVLSLLLEDFWYSLTAIEHAQLIKYMVNQTQRNVKIKRLEAGSQCYKMSWTYMFECISNRTRI